MKKAKYKPNRIPADIRAFNIVCAFALMSYGAYSLWRDDLYLPTRRGPELHLHGFPAVLHVGAFMAAAAVMISIVVDHYDRRDNERLYRRFARYGQVIGWSLFVLSLALEFIDHKF